MLDRVDHLLLFLCAALNLGGFLFGAPHGSDGSHIPPWMGLPAIVLLIAFSVRTLLRSAHHSLARWAMFGIVCAFAGDLLLSELFVAQSVSILPAIAVFSVAYGAYIVGALRTPAPNGGTAPPGRPAALRLVIWAGFLTLGAGLWYVIVLAGGAKGPLLWAGLAYALLLATLPGVSAGLAVTQHRRWWWLAAGGFVVMTSDLALATKLFNRPLFIAALPAAIRGDFIWLTYTLGQTLILVGTARLAR